MIIAAYHNGLLVEPKFYNIYEGQIFTALYLNGSKKTVIRKGRSFFAVEG